MGNRLTEDGMGYDAIRTIGTADHLVLTFHGTGATSDQLHGLARHFLPNAHVVSPQGDAVTEEDVENPGSVNSILSATAIA